MNNDENLFTITSSIYGKGFITHLSSVFLFAAIASTAQFILTYFLGIIIDSVKYGYPTVMHYFIVISIAVVFNVLGNALWSLFSSKMFNQFLRNIRSLLGQKLCKSEYAEIEKIKDGDLLSIVTNDSENFRSWFNSLSSLGLLPAKIVLVVIFDFIISWKLTLIMIPTVPLTMLPSLFLSKKLCSLNTAEREAAGKTTGFLGSTLNFVLVLKSFCLEKVFIAKNRRILSDAEKASMSRTLREQIIQTLGRCIGNITNPLFFIAGAYFIVNNEMTIGQMITIMLMANMVGEAMNIIYAIPTSYQTALAGMRRVKKIVQLKEEDYIKNEDALQPINDAPIFEFSNFNFSYEDVPILKNINFAINKGEKISIVGMSGSGKTTLLKLMCGLYKPEDGSLYYRGLDTSDLPVEWLRNSLSIVPQESFLFNGSIKDNIRISMPAADDHAIVEACKKAQIHEFILSLPGGYDTTLIDANKSMSKGQMQRINLARAFLRDAPVYLLDEPTSALDMKTQNAVMDQILDETPGKTVVVILHNLTELQRFDRILVMKNGKIAGFGRHDELIAANSDYIDILSKQIEGGEN